MSFANRDRRWVLVGSVFVVVGLLSSSIFAQANERFRSWNQPIEPFRIVGNLYYVGANDITSYLVATPEGHILIDGGFEETAPQIRDNLATLGFDIADVEILLNSHAHFDHCAGLAQLAEWSGAEVWIGEGDIDVIESGGETDFFLKDEVIRFPPVEVDRALKDGDTVRLGGSELTARITAGHTKGCTTWTLTVEEAGTQVDVVSVCSMTVLPGFQLVDNPEYPEAVEDYARSFEILEGLEADVFLASHGRFIDLDTKRQRLAEGESNLEVFVDREGYRSYVAMAREHYEKVLREQRENRETD